MAKFHIKKVDTSTEQRIITGMIVSTKFLKEIEPNLELDYFQNGYAKIVAEWVIDYYKEYSIAPFKDIQDIFEVRSSKELSEDDQTVVKEFLSKLSKRFDSEEEFNVGFHVETALEYFKKRELEITVDNAKYYLTKGQVEEAEREFLGYRKVARVYSGWSNPLDLIEVASVFDEKQTSFFKFPGAFGRFIGELERGWVVGVAGKSKIGKTYFLNEFAVQGMLRKRRVAFFSLEMKKASIYKRLYQRMTSTGEIAKAHMYPVIDCLLNQTGECDDRPAQPVLADSDGIIPDFSSDIPHEVCVQCRGTRRFEPALWYIVHDRPEFDLLSVAEKIATLRKYFAKYVRYSFHNRMEVNCRDIQHKLDILRDTEGFDPDIIVIDYADIMRPEEEGLVGIDKEDMTWISLSKLASDNNALVVPATQVNRQALEAAVLQQKHTAKWVGKLFHVDGMLGLSQTKTEKKKGLLRVGWLLHRHHEFSESANITLLQNLSVGQVHLDADYLGGQS